MDLITIIIAIPVTLLLVYLLLKMFNNGKGKTIVTHKGVVDRIREMGDLVALTAFYKDIATKKSTNKLWDFLGGKKMAVISEFDLEYRYDLHKADIKESNNKVKIIMPICTTKVSTGDIEIYDEHSPNLFGIPIPLTNFSVDDRNSLIAGARESATITARKKTDELLPKIEKSARDTLTTLLQASGVENIEIEF
ncbi:DUF4230 domain-containing protein, partial [bacterium]|nr:DUF4230 domain-containing protein [bacterium]